MQGRSANTWSLVWTWKASTPSSVDRPRGEVGVDCFDVHFFLYTILVEGGEGARLRKEFLATLKPCRCLTSSNPCKLTLGCGSRYQLGGSLWEYQANSGRVYIAVLLSPHHCFDQPSLGVPRKPVPFGRIDRCCDGDGAIHGKKGQEKGGKKERKKKQRGGMAGRGGRNLAHAASPSLYEYSSSM